MAERLLLRVAFDGRCFHGTQRQPDVPTVNGAILDALGEAGYLSGEPRLRAQGRIDAGVSARDFPLALNVRDAEIETVAATVAGRVPGVIPFAAARVNGGYDPRLHARSRTYRYFVAGTRTLDLERLRAAWSAFEGTHDLSSFARLEPAKRDQDPVRAITRARAWPRGGGIVLEVTAPSFLRHQVRRMVGASRTVARGELGLEQIDEALSGGELKTHAKADPGGLVLWRVALSADWRPLDRAEAIACRRLGTDHARAVQRASVLDGIRPRAPG